VAPLEVLRCKGEAHPGAFGIQDPFIFSGHPWKCGARLSFAQSTVRAVSISCRLHHGRGLAKSCCSRSSSRRCAVLAANGDGVAMVG
jgi:hypothetical protein